MSTQSHSAPRTSSLPPRPRPRPAPAPATDRPTAPAPPTDGPAAPRPRLGRHLKAIVACPGLFAVLLPSVFLGVAELAARLWPAAQVPSVNPAPRIWAIAVVAAGLALFVWTNILFHRHGGTLHPNDGPPALVESGPYAVMRNPMIAGVILFLAGMAGVLGSWVLAGYLVLFVVAKTIYLKVHEEPVLRRMFPGYPAYQRRTPFLWIPYRRRQS